MSIFRYFLIPVILGAITFGSCRKENGNIQRPEKIVSLREVVYDKDTYVQLASLWKQYNEAYPSEEAYANWMYAARYADAADYYKGQMLEAGVKRYPANPKLLYLKAQLRKDQTQNLESLSLLERAIELDPFLHRSLVLARYSLYGTR